MTMWRSLKDMGDDEGAESCFKKLQDFEKEPAAEVGPPVEAVATDGGEPDGAGSDDSSEEEAEEV